MGCRYPVQASGQFRVRSMQIQTNVTALFVARNLDKSGSATQTSMRRLNSGLRINSAKDDAAGLAIADRFTSRINGMEQGIRNTNDSVSMLQTAEQALSSVADSLQRIRVLSVQAANLYSLKSSN